MTKINANVFCLKYMTLLFLLFINNLNSSIFAQSSTFLKSRNDSCIRNLSAGGTLIIRLKSEKKKLDYLAHQLELNAKNEKSRSKIQKIIDKTKTERDQFNRSIIDAFKSDYSFSKLNFIYDSDIVEWKKSNYDTRYFIDANLKNEKNISKPFYLILKNDNTPSGLEAFIFTDVEGSLMLSPFPTSIRVNNLRVAIWEIAKLENRLEKNAIRIANAAHIKLANYESKYLN